MHAKSYKKVISYGSFWYDLEVAMDGVNGLCVNVINKTASKKNPSIWGRNSGYNS